MIDIRAMGDDETGVWAALRTRLWPHCGPEDNAADITAYRTGGPVKVVFLAFAGDIAIGFAEISERSIADGCGLDPAAYLEGWYVEPGYQRQGIGAALIAAVVDWAGASGYPFLASDAELGNKNSQKAHAALGFEETGRVVRYRMRVQR